MNVGPLRTGMNETMEFRNTNVVPREKHPGSTQWRAGRDDGTHVTADASAGTP